ncbi:hypothetical protein RclHR1_06570007 [Rhizophagus clarus]|uniref:Uncharacterized protein LOC107044738 n=1 Tax=Rhizophagus clarus TaxID=94130 RepID=A0A2Z6RYJ9_9GLOM|nr:hypothetical protein RclHR1_06570007 [Rhizophagus clarus]GES97088.1 uncharacterized protein LOC107044738 [Rhizophagus clarus]
MSMRYLSTKTAFLLALATASRPSNLRRVYLSTDKKTYSFGFIQSKVMELHSIHSLSSTKAPVNKIYTGTHNEEYFCPYKAFTAFTERTQSCHDTLEKKRALFLITRKPFSPAATDTLANWIKSVVQKSSVTSSANDIRTFSAFSLQMLERIRPQY